MHRGKSKVVPKGALKLITGVVIQNGNTHATTAQHRKTKELTVALTVTTNSGTKAEIAQSLLGHLDHIAQIDERFKARAVGSRGRLASLVK